LIGYTGKQKRDTNAEGKQERNQQLTSKNWGSGGGGQGERKAGKYDCLRNGDREGGAEGEKPNNTVKQVK